MGKRSWRYEILVMVIAALVLEATACIQYFTSRAAIKRTAVERAASELRKAELEINVVTAKTESAVKMMAKMVERHIDDIDSIAAMSQILMKTLDDVNGICIGFQPYYFAKKGKWFELYTIRRGELIQTAEIGNINHDYLNYEWYLNGFAHQGCWWSEPYYDNSGAKSMVVTCSHPIYDKKGEIVGVAGIDINLDKLQQISEYLQIYPDSYYSISSSKGLDIVSAKDTLPGRKYYIFSEDIESTGWKMEIIIPDDVLFAELRRTGLIITLMMLLGMIVLAFILYRSARTTQKLISSNEKNERIESELNVARTIQMAMLPKVFPPFADRSNINIYGSVDPAKEIGGDLYDFYLRHDKLFFCIGDVSGKGVPASLLMTMTRSLFRNITAHNENAKGIVEEMNKAIAEQNTQNMFLTMFIGVLDFKSGRLDYCNAGHCAPVIVNGKTNKLMSLNVLPNLPLGIEPDYKFKPQSVPMELEDLIFLYTDGLTEAENEVHEQFQEDRMMQALSNKASASPRELIRAMKKDVENFVNGAEQSDDLTMLAIRYQTPALFMRNDIQQIPSLAEWIDSLGIPEELNMQINLALEEAVSNIMLYAYPGSAGQVCVEYNESKNQIAFTLTDGGIAFDPTVQAEPDTELPLEERPIGGLGIHLVRQIMDEISYKRENDLNILTLIKHI